MKISFLIVLLFVSISNMFPKSEISVVKQNFQKIYLDDVTGSPLMRELVQHQPGFIISDRVVMELQQRVPFDRDRIERYIKNLSKDGSWADINYNDTKRSGWDPRLHPERILEMVKAFMSPGVEYYKSPALEKTIHSAMDYWFKAGLKCSNWYYNEIGVPRTLGTAFILFDEYLTADERVNAVRIMENSKFGMTGQNKVWLAGNVMMRAVLQNDLNLVKQARDIIVSEITKGGLEGIKDDWSFHQHGPQQQFGNYGLAYIYTMSLFSGIFADTSLAFSNEQLRILSTLLTEGYQWIIWNRKMDISALGRQLFSSAPLHKALSLAFAANSLSGDVSSILMSNCFSDDNSFVGHKHFWQSDYTVSRRHDWMATLKMSSQRVIGVESLNGDNMRGYYMADGALYVYKDSSEYYDIFPLWDWRRLPGVTAYLDDNSPMPQPDKKDKYTNRTNFVGGLSDGKNGISAMLLRKDGLSADKFWFFADSAIVCFGTGIESDSTLQVVTSIEQCWEKGKVQVYRGAEPISFKEGAEYDMNDLKILHNGLGYLFFQNEGKCIIDAAKVKGNWHDIMQMYPEETVSGNVFSIYLNHGKCPENVSYSYMIIPGADSDLLRNFNRDAYCILSNDRNIQSVIHNDVCWAAVKNPSTLDLSVSVSVNFLTAGLYRIEIHNGKVYSVMYSDPTQQLDTVSFLINNRKFTSQLPIGVMKGTVVHVSLANKK